MTIDFSDMSGPSEQSIQAATLKSLQLADTLEVRSIAFLALTGTARFPFQLAAEIMTRTIAEYLLGDTQIERVMITLLVAERTETLLESFK